MNNDAHNALLVCAQMTPKVAVEQLLARLQIDKGAIMQWEINEAFSVRRFSA